MRKLFLPGLAIVLFFMASCTQKESRLTGKWTVASCAITNLDQLRASQLEGVPDSLMSQMKERLEGQINAYLEEAKKEVYTFKKDSFILDRRGKIDKGTWKISTDHKSLFLIPLQSPAAEVIAIQMMKNKELHIAKKLTAESDALFVLRRE